MKTKTILHSLMLLLILMGFLQLANDTQRLMADDQKIQSLIKEANSLEMRNEFEKALLTWKKISELDNIDHENLKLVLYHIAMLNLNKKDRSSADAINALSGILGLYPTDTTAHYELGVLYSELNLFKDAIAHLTEVVNLAPDHARAHFYLGKIYFQKKQYEMAFKEFQLAADKISDNETNSKLYYSLGYIYHQKNVFDASIEYLKQSIEYDKSNMEAHLLLVDDFIATKDFENAAKENYFVKTFNGNEKKIDLNETRITEGKRLLEQVAATINQGKELFRLRRWQDSFEEFKKALALDSTSTEAQRMIDAAKTQIFNTNFNRGIRLSKQGQWITAAQEFTKAQKFSVTEKQNADATNALAKAQAEEIFISRVDGLQAEGTNALDNKEWEEAQQIFEAVLRLDPDRASTRAQLKLVNVQFSYQLGIRAMAEKNWGLAKHFFNQVLVTDKNFPDAMEKLDEVKILQQADNLKNQANVAMQQKEWRIAKKNLISALKLHDDAEARQLLEAATKNRKRELYVNIFMYLLIVLIVLFVIAYLLNKWIKTRKEMVKILKRRRVNPYMIGPPIFDDEQFFNRTDLITRILNSIHNNSFLIKGDRRSGKTSLLHILEKKIVTLREKFDEFFFIPVYISLAGVEETDLFRRLAGGIFERADFHFLRSVELDYWKPNSGYGSQRLLSDLNVGIEKLKIQKQREIRVVLLLDEFDIMNEYSEASKNSFRNIFMEVTSESLKIVATAVHIKKWTGEASPWENFLIEIKMNSFSIQDAKELIEKPVKGFINYTGDAVNQIFKYTKGNPYFIQKICGLLIDDAYKKDKVTIDLLAVNDIYLAFKQELLKEGFQLD